MESLSCEIDPVAPIHLNTALNTAYAQMATLSAFTDSVPDDYTTEVILPHTKRIDAPLLPELGPDLISGAVAMDNATFTTFQGLARETSVMSQFNCRALLDTGSSQPFIWYGCTSFPMRQCNAMSSPF